MHLLQSVRAALPLVAVLVGASEADAQTAAWSRMAIDDLAVARALIVENHPGAAAEVGDGKFQRQLELGYADASAIASQAHTYGDYRAALVRFAAAFDDHHIQSNPLVQAPRYWPGFMVGLRRNLWVVMARATQAAPEPGTRLLSCDGRSPDALAAARLAPFYANWAVRASQVRASRDLLIDSGNSGQPRLKECTFAVAYGERRTVPLNWERIPAGPPVESAAPSQPQVPDVGLTKFNGGWWLRLGTSGGQAVPLLKQARLRQVALRSAPFVVLDLHGNDGGASFFTDALAEIIYGHGRVAQARRPQGIQEAEQIVWRVSRGALQTLETYVPRVARIASDDHPGVLGMMAQRDLVRRALAARQPVARAPAQVISGSSAKPPPDPASPPRVILITDRRCFSSCLIGAWLFRKLGVINAGEETDANTRYSDLRTIDLPSGLSTFSTLQSYSTYSPMQFGPYCQRSLLRAI